MAVRMHSPLSIQEILAQPKNTQLVEQLLGKKAALSRTGLAKELCRRLDLRDSKGNDRLSTTRKVLRDLEVCTIWLRTPFGPPVLGRRIGSSLGTRTPDGEVR